MESSYAIADTTRVCYHRLGTEDEAWGILFLFLFLCLPIPASLFPNPIHFRIHDPLLQSRIAMFLPADLGLSLRYGGRGRQPCNPVAVRSFHNPPPHTRLEEDNPLHNCLFELHGQDRTQSNISKENIRGFEACPPACPPAIRTPDGCSK